MSVATVRLSYLRRVPIRVAAVRLSYLRRVPIQTEPENKMNIATVRLSYIRPCEICYVCRDVTYD
jgi:hypothetical protein